MLCKVSIFVKFLDRFLYKSLINFSSYLLYPIVLLMSMTTSPFVLPSFQNETLPEFDLNILGRYNALRAGHIYDLVQITRRLEGVIADISAIS